ncbi:hypothetical protein GW17_00031530 [Ensete ventricosum]|nr:hypothetical protein GW17_00031530 [Ensete ventricosum]
MGLLTGARARCTGAPEALLLDDEDAGGDGDEEAIEVVSEEVGAARSGRWPDESRSIFSGDIRPLIYWPAGLTRTKSSM